MFFVIFCCIFVIYCNCSSNEYGNDDLIAIKRPSDGENGTILISLNESNINDTYWNRDRIMISFDLECLNDTFKAFNVSVDAVRDEYIDCMKKSNVGTFKTDISGYSFYDLECTIDTIQSLNKSINYTDLCIEWIIYEPIYYTLQSNNDIPTRLNITTCMLDEVGDSQWGLDRLQSVERNGLYYYPEIEAPNSNYVDLYIIDSGVQSNHDEFFDGQVQHLMGNGPAYYSDKNWFGTHGTHVAGIAGGKTFGSSRNFKIYDLRVCEYDTEREPKSPDDIPCYGSLIFEALETVLERLKKDPYRRGVINMSLGGPKTILDQYQSWFNKIEKQGGIVVVAAGNENQNACNVSPAYADNAITVGAHNTRRVTAGFSNYGNCVNIWAPGVGIDSSIASEFTDAHAEKSGTSMASPYIAGITANLLYVDPFLTRDEIQQIFESPSSLVTSNVKCPNNGDCLAPIYDCNNISFLPGSRGAKDNSWTTVWIVIGSVVGGCCVIFILWYLFQQCGSYIKSREAQKARETQETKQLRSDVEGGGTNHETIQLGNATDDY